MALDTFNPYLFVSAGEQSNKFLTPTYADGIAQFQAQRAQSLTGLTVRIDPIQEGTGDPAPDNIRPITGRTGLTVTAAGKNLCGELLQGYWAFADGTAVTSGTWVKTPKIRCKGSTTYTASSDYESHWMGFLFYDQSGAFISTDNRTGQTKKYTAASPANAAYMAVNVNAVTSTTGVTPEEVTSFQLEESAAQTAYTPYVGQTYSVTWETEAGEVYGGTLDVVSGVLTVTHAAVQIKDKTWTYDATNTRFGAPFLQDIAIDATRRQLILCDAFAPFTDGGAVSSVPNNSIYNGGTDGRLYVKTDTATTAANFVSAYGNYHIVFPLATPTTYQLTPEDVKTLAGFNQIYSDAGPVIDIKF